jgi:flagellar biosynthesis protein FliR
MIADDSFGLLTGRVEDELVVTKNVTRLSIHQKTLAFIIETLTLFTLCTILRNNALSVSRVAAKIDDSDWQGLVTTLAPALKNGVISMPVTLTVTLVLMRKSIHHSLMTVDHIVFARLQGTFVQKRSQRSDPLVLVQT